MATVRKTITLTDHQDHWIKAQVAGGQYTNDSEYIRRGRPGRHLEVDAPHTRKACS
jgi:antitoxin ParD1/3/4